MVTKGYQKGVYDRLPPEPGNLPAVAKPLMLRERGCIRRVRLMRGQSHWEQKSKGTTGVAGAVSAEFSMPRCSSTGISARGEPRMNLSNLATQINQ